MRHVGTLLVFTLAFLPAGLAARQQPDVHVVAGATIFFPNSIGTVDGPSNITALYAFGNPVSVSSIYRSNALLRLTAGIRFDQLRMGFFIHYAGVQIGRPDLQEGSETDFEIRYVFWDYGLGNFSAIASIKNGAYHQQGGMYSDGYEFTENRWLPGIGLGGNFSVIHADIQVRGWPRTIIAYGHVPNGQPVDQYGRIPYDLQPIYLNYVVNMTVSFEFNVFSF